MLAAVFPLSQKCFPPLWVEKGELCLAACILQELKISLISPTLN